MTVGCATRLDEISEALTHVIVGDPLKATQDLKEIKSKGLECVLFHGFKEIQEIYQKLLNLLYMVSKLSLVFSTCFRQLLFSQFHKENQYFSLLKKYLYEYFILFYRLLLFIIYDYLIDLKNFKIFVIN